MRSAKNYVIVFLAGTTLACAVLAWRQYQELISLRAAALNLREAPSWPKRLDTASANSIDGGPAAMAVEAESAEHDGAAIDPSDPATASVHARRERGPRGPNMMDDPEVQKLMAVQRKAGLDGRYAALFRMLNLPPEQLDQLKNLLVDKSTAMADIMAVAREQGINRRDDPAMFNQLIADAQAEIDANIRTTLGEVGYAQYLDYERTLPQRSVASQLEQRLSYSSTPLTPDQTAQLVKILANTNPSSSTGTPTTGRNFGGGPLVTDAAINQALGTLAAPQIEALRELQREQQLQAELGAAMRQRFQRGQPMPIVPAIPVTPATKTPGG
jgi:hypothetical protein